MSDLENVNAPKIGGSLPHDHYIKVLHSIAISLKRIADKMEKSDPGIPVYRLRDGTEDVLGEG